MSTTAIILASGAGSRFRSETPKQFLKPASVQEHTLDVFEQCVGMDATRVPTNHARKGAIRGSALQYRPRRVHATGGTNIACSEGTRN